MKAWIAVLLALVLCFGMTACGDSGPLSSLGGEKGGANEIVIPEAVLNLTEEDEILLNGELKDGVYTNRYFGIRFTAPEGWSLRRLNDDATDTAELISLREAYEQEMGGISFMAVTEDSNGYILVIIRAQREDERGLSEEELVRQNNERIWEISKIFGEDQGPELKTAMFAGEEHPMGIQTSQTQEGEALHVSFYLPKGDFVYDVSISTPGGALEEMTALFEQL